MKSLLKQLKEIRINDQKVYRQALIIRILEDILKRLIKLEKAK